MGAVDLKKYILNERLTEYINSGDIFPFPDFVPKSSPGFGDPPPQPLCVHYNPKQKPKHSYGVALYNRTTGCWLLIEPRTTIEMRVIISGYYTRTSLGFLVDQLYEEELDHLSGIEGESSFEETYRRYYSQTIKEDFHYAVSKLCWDRDWLTIRNLCRETKIRRELSSRPPPSQRIFPKGRPLEGETTFSTAIREVEEETNIGIKLDHPSFPGKIKPNSPMTQPHQESIWESCTVEFSGFCSKFREGNRGEFRGYICKDNVSHLHSDINGKLYKTTLWICIFNSETNPTIPYDPANFESRAGVWVRDEELLNTSRVTGLSQKCQVCLSRHLPQLKL